MKEEWLSPGAVVPVDAETTAALVAEIKRMVDVMGGMALRVMEACAEREATLERNNLTWVANCQHLVAAEREECAKLAEAWGAWIGDGQLVANAIRTRVDKK